MGALVLAGQGRRDDVAYLRNQTRQSGIELVSALSLRLSAERELWDVENAPTWVARVEAMPGQTVTVEKIVAIYTSRDAKVATLVDKAVNAVNACAGWESAHRASVEAWAEEWAHTDVLIEGDDEAQLSPPLQSIPNAHCRAAPRREGEHRGQDPLRFRLPGPCLLGHGRFLCCRCSRIPRHTFPRICSTIATTP